MRGFVAPISALSIALHGFAPATIAPPPPEPPPYVAPTNGGSGGIGGGATAFYSEPRESVNWTHEDEAVMLVITSFLHTVDP